jgi:hypothetical protein
MADDNDEAAHLAYVMRLHEIEHAGERTTISIGPFSAITLIGLLQLSTRHPDASRTVKDVARDIVRQLEPLFAGTEGEEIVRRGSHPEWDV